MMRYQQKSCRHEEGGRIVTEIAVVGLGYVGLPLAMAFCDAGVTVHGADIDADRAKMLWSGKSYIDDVPDSKVSEHIKSERFIVDRFPFDIKDCEAVFICVPTPCDRYKRPDLYYLSSAAEEVSWHMAKGQLIIVQSTSWPGTTMDFVVPILESRSGLSYTSEEFEIAFVPERINPGGNADIASVPKIVGTNTDAEFEHVKQLYSMIVVTVHRASTPATAEMAKLLENTFRAVNIALVNEIAMLCEKMGLDVWEVIEAASTKPYGFMPFYPSAGVGGHCIPVDPYYLLHKAAEYNTHLSIVERALSINESMPQHVVGLVYKHAARRGIAIRDDNVLLIGGTYKPNVRDTRNAPAGAIFDIDRSFTVWDALLDDISLEQRLDGIDIAVILINHDGVDYQMIIDKTELVIDCCNATDGLCDDYGRVVRLGSGD